MAGWLWAEPDPDDASEAFKKVLDSAEAEDNTPLTLEQREQVLAELMKLSGEGEEDWRGLPQYRFANGSECSAEESPILSDKMIRRYLLKARGDAADAAQAILNTLHWRRRILPDFNPSKTRPAMLLEEEKRFRVLGPNADGDLVFGLNFLFGDFINEEVSLLDCLRTCVLAVERAVQDADACDHPRLVLIMFGGPPPVLFAQGAARFLQDHYPHRLKRAVIYPVPAIFAHAVWLCLSFLREETRQKIGIASEEAQAVELGHLTGPEQLPEGWRGGIEEVGERYQVDGACMQSIMMEYLNPFGGTVDETLLDMEEPWRSEEGGDPEPPCSETPVA